MSPAVCGHADAHRVQARSQQLTYHLSLSLVKYDEYDSAFRFT